MSSVTIDSPARAGRWDRFAPVLLVSLGLCFYVFRAADWFRAVPGDLGDARFNSVILEHLYQWVRGDAASLWSPDFFYPTRGTLAFSDNHFGSGAVYVLSRFLGLGREHAFTVWFAVGNALNFVAMYGVMRRLRFATLPAAAAAFIFAFNLPALAQVSHAQLTYRFATPLAFLAFLQFAQERRLWQLARLAAWGAVQFFCSIYLGLFLVYLLAATALALLLPALRPAAPALACGESPRGKALSIAVIVLSAAATGWLMLKYQGISQSFGFRRSAAEIMIMLPRLKSYLLADGVEAYRWLGSTAQSMPIRHEHQLFLGFAPLLLCLYAALGARGADAEPRRWLLRICQISFLVLFVGTLYVGHRSLYQLVMGLPGISAIRAVSRIVLVMAVPVAIMAAIGIERLQRTRIPRGAVTVLVIAALSVEVFAYRPHGDSIAAWRDRLAPLAAAVADSPLKDDSVIYVTGRLHEPDYLTELDAMVFAQDRKLPTLNGYSGNMPPGYVPPHPCTPPTVRIHTLADAIFAKSKLAPDALLARTRWIASDPCPLQHPATGAAAALPDERQARLIQLDAAVTGVVPGGVQAEVRIHNNADGTLHSVSRTGNHLRLSWRLTQTPASGDLLNPSWFGRQDLFLSIPPGEEETFRLAIPVPAGAGPQELQFSIVAEGYRWLHDLGMPIARVPLDGNAAQPR